VISFDMGGTSTDVCRITGGVPSVRTGHRVAGRVNRVPSVPIRTIGAGGGSIAWVDDGGALRVGPRSAGANPGPAAYGSGGTDLTVTDANVLAGHIPADLSLGGSVVLDRRAAEVAARRLADVAGLAVERVVAGVLEVVDSHMERALREVSVEEGADPRDSALVAFGGAGGLHASRLARRLGIETVLVPPHSGVFSALGLLLATPRADAVRTVMLEDGGEALETAYARVLDEAVGRYRQMFGRPPEQTALRVDLRYAGQSHELDVDAGVGWDVLRIRFHAAHKERFGFDRVGERIELVNIRATAWGAPPLTWDTLPDPGKRTTPIGSNDVWRRETLPEGFTVGGPAVIVEDNSATLLEGGDRLLVLPDGTLQIRQQ
jgi:N-methylhydantoinase A